MTNSYHLVRGICEPEIVAGIISKAESGHGNGPWLGLLKLHAHIRQLEKAKAKIKFWLVDWEQVGPATELAFSSLQQAAANNACLKYWQTMAKHIPAARELAALTGLEFPSPKTPTYFKYELYPIRRLVVCGADKAENIALFFGPCKCSQHSVVFIYWPVE